jgi:putative membrane protein
MMGYGGYGGFGGFGMVIGFVILVAGIVGLVFLALWAVRHLRVSSQTGVQNPTGQSAIEIAKERYAKGEINREEFQNIMAELER